MEDIRPKPALARPALYVIVAAFLLGSFAGAAFGVVFAVSLNDRYALWKTDLPAPPPEAEKLVSTEDVQVVAAVRKASPSVVSIVIRKEISRLYERTGLLPFEEFFGLQLPAPEENDGGLQQIGGGTGFVISADGLILTNRHVVADPEAVYEVVMADGRSFPAEIVARDAVLDVAVLKVAATGLPVPDLGDSDALEIGETVIAIGNALSEYRNTVTKGVISGTGRRVVAGDSRGSSEVLEEALQTDAAINPGNSGGPLVNLRGQVIGVNTAVNREGQSIGFAIPVNALRVVIDSVKETGRIVRPWLGVRYVLIDPETARKNGYGSDTGALILAGDRPNEPAVAKDSPADKAGLRENDLLLEIDGTPITDAHPLSSLIGRKRAGETAVVAYLREGVRKTVEVRLAELPAQLP